jgi:hypothetical protein
MTMAKKSETKKAEAKDKKTETAMTAILDKLLEAGGTLEDIAKAAAAEQEKRGGNRYKTGKGIIAHMKARAGAKNPVKYNVPLDKIEEDTFVQVAE